MRCPHCGSQVPDTARACGHCGQWLDAAPTRRGLVADTLEQVADWLASVDLTVTLDEISLPNTADYWGEIEKVEDLDEDGDAEYVSRWVYPVGTLSPGTHSVETEYRLQWPVTDGFDSDGDSSPDEFYEPWGYSLQIIVEE